MNGYINELEIAFERNKHLDWDYDELSSNEYITWNMVRNNLQKPWNFEKLSYNPAITWENICDTPFLRWHWPSVTVNLNITVDIIANNIWHPWDFTILENILSKEEFQYLMDCKDNYIEEEYYSDSYDENNVLYTI